MKDTTRPKAEASKAALPTFQQVIALALAKAEQNLRRLIEIRCNDERWADADVDVDFAVELALTHLERMKAMSFENYNGLDYEWFKVAAALKLGKKQFSRPDCNYSRTLESTCNMFDQMAELFEFVEPA